MKLLLLTFALFFAPSASAVSSTFEYCKAGNQSLHLDLAQPPSGTAKHPMLLFLHGGGWTSGTRADFADIIQLAAARGYVAATADYRLTGRLFPGQIDDATCAVRWLRTHAAEHGGDPAKIGVVGVSAGGHLALLLGLRGGDPSSRVQAVVNWFGPTDLAALYAAVDSSYKKDFEEHLGGSPRTRPAVYEALSPLHFVSRDDPPVLTIHGTADPIVPFAQAQALDAALKAAGVDHELMTVEGGGHGFDAAQMLLGAERTFAFLDARLKR